MDKKMTECYFAKTCLTLDERMKMMTKEYNTLKKSNKPMPELYKSIDKHGLENIVPVMVEEYPCENDAELRQRQTYHMLHTVPHLNKTTPVKVKDPSKTDEDKERGDGS